MTRAGTAGDVLAPMVVDALITQAAAARQRGIAVLADTGRHKQGIIRHSQENVGNTHRQRIGKECVRPTGVQIHPQTQTLWPIRRGELIDVVVQRQKATGRPAHMRNEAAQDIRVLTDETRLFLEFSDEYSRKFRDTIRL